MGNFLAATGRARPTQTMLSVLEGKLAVERGDRRERLVNSEIAESNERLEKVRRVNQLEAEQVAEMNKVLPVDSLLDSIEGGAESPMAQRMLKTAKSYGMVDERGGIKMKDLMQMQQVIQQPQYAHALANDRVEFYKGRMNQAKAILAEKPQDKNALQTYQESKTMYEAAFAAVPGVKELWDNQIEAAKAAKTASKAKKAYMHMDNPKDIIYVPSDEAPPEGYVPYSKGTGKERDRELRREQIPRIQQMYPENAYAEGWRVNDDGTLHIGYDGAPVKLPDFTEKLGKRGGPKAIKAAGELWDDAKELKDLLEDPEVSKNLKKAQNAGLWDRVKGSWSNRIDTWMSKNGILANTPTSTAIRRMQRMASEERKNFLGAAVTQTELESVLGWMPSAGDSYDAMLNKINLIEKEGRQEFKRFLDIYKDVANMAPYYKAFGLNRFSEQNQGTLKPIAPMHQF